MTSAAAEAPSRSARDYNVDPNTGASADSVNNDNPNTGVARADVKLSYTAPA